MKTFYWLAKNKGIIKPVKALNIQWNKTLNTGGSFSIQATPDQLRSLDGVRYVYREGDRSLGVILSITETWSPSTGVLFQISGNFVEGQLFKIPVAPYSPLKHLDNYPCSYIKAVVDRPGTDIYSLLSEDIVFANSVIFVAQSQPAEGMLLPYIKSWSEELARICLHDLKKYLQSMVIFDYVVPCDTVNGVNYDEGFDLWDRADVIVPSQPEFPAKSDMITPAMLYAVDSNDSSSLGDVLLTWVNNAYCTNRDGFPPYTISMRCVFDIETKKIDLIITDDTNFSKIDLTSKNMKSWSMGVDTSNSDAGGMVSAVYLDDGDYKVVQRDKRFDEEIVFDKDLIDYHKLSLNQKNTGKISTKVNYLGNTFADYVTKYDGILYCNEAINNYNNTSPVESINVSLIPESLGGDYIEYFDVGDFINFRGELKRIVEIREVVKGNKQEISLILSASRKNMFRNYYDMVNSPFEQRK